MHRDLVGTLLGPHQARASNPVRFELSTGGVGANLARAAVSSGLVDVVRLVAPTGADGLAPDVATSGFEGIDICAVPVAGSEAGRYVAIIDADGDLVSGYADTSACDAADAVPLLAECPASARSMVIDANLSTTTMDTLLTSLPIARYALAVSPHKAVKLLPLADRIDTLFCNRREAAAMTGRALDEPLSTLSKSLEERGFSTHVLTDGSSELIVLNNGELKTVAVAPVTSNEHGNSNGAGDALAGATIAAVHIGQSLASAVTGAGLVAAQEALART